MNKTAILLLLALAGSLPLLAQDSDTAAVAMDEVVIADKRIQLPYSLESRSISIMDKTLIDATPATSIAGLLYHVSSVDVRSRGVNGIQSDVGIRGGTFEQTLVMLNGIRLSDPQTGHHTMNLPVDAVSIGRIEVLKGPGARTFGQNAFSGAINLITRRPQASFLRAGMQVGDFALWGGNLSGALVKGKQNHYLSVSYDRSQGYKYNTDYQILTSYYQGYLALGAGELSITGGFSGRNFGANGFYASPDYTDQYEEVRTGLAALGYEVRLGASRLTVRSYYRQNNDTYIFLRQDPAFYQNDHINRTLGIEANMAIPLGRGTTGVGIDLNRVTLNSNNLGQQERQVASLFAEHNFVLLQEKLSLTPGVQVNYYSDFGLNALPGLDIGYSVARHWRLYGSVGYTYRVPSYTEMYYRDPVNQGNADLLPEYAMNYEVGGKTLGYERLQGSISVFYRQGRNMIDWVRAADTLPWQANNILQVNMAGLELEARYRWRTAHGLLALQELQGYYTYINAAFEASETLQSRYALENLRHQFRGTVVLAYGKRLTHTITAAYYDRVNLPDYTLVDTRLSYRQKRLSLFVDITNLLDVAYRETNLVSMPGRWFKAGLQVKVL